MNDTQLAIRIFEECCDTGEIIHIPIEEQMVQIKCEVGELDRFLIIDSDLSKLEDLYWSMLSAQRDAFITGLGTIYGGKHIDLADYLVIPPCEFIKPQIRQSWDPKPVKKLISASQQSFRSRMRSVNRNR